MRNISIMIDVAIEDSTDPEALAESVFDFLAADPEDLFPAIEAVNSYDYKVLS
jgi:hypothetical protein